jgi:hypothetical protein
MWNAHVGAAGRSPEQAGVVVAPSSEVTHRRRPGTMGDAYKSERQSIYARAAATKCHFHMGLAKFHEVVQNIVPNFHDQNNKDFRISEFPKWNGNPCISSCEMQSMMMLFPKSNANYCYNRPVQLKPREARLENCSKLWFVKK